MRPLIIYHSPCTDGFTAAWVCRRALGADAEFFPCGYPQPPIDSLPDPTGREVYVVDYSFGPAELESLARKAARVVVLDHHEKAVAALAGFRHEKVELRLDVSRSGARLCWEYFFSSRPVHWLVAYTEDRDLWKWALPDSRQVSAAISSHPYDFATWDGWALAGPTVLPVLVAEGAGILRYQQTAIDRILDGAMIVRIAGHDVLACNTQVLTSEVAGALAKAAQFGACWYVDRSGVERWSLRSEPGGANVNEVAKLYGGGGHPRAAGFARHAAIDRDF